VSEQLQKMSELGARLYLHNNNLLLDMKGNALRCLQTRRLDFRLKSIASWPTVKRELNVCLLSSAKSGYKNVNITIPAQRQSVMRYDRKCYKMFADSNMRISAKQCRQLARSET